LPVALVLAAVIAMTFVSGELGTASAESIDGCGRTGPRIDGGQTGLGLQDSALTVPVPDDGTFLSLPARPDEALVPSLFICHVESGSSIVLDGRTGREVVRSVGDPSGAAVLDEIAANARVESKVLTPPDPGASTMTPPMTGDAGLKRP
jgi:hypothetical protein